MNKSIIGIVIGVICVGIVFFVYTSVLESEKTSGPQSAEMENEEVTSSEENNVTDIEDNKENERNQEADVEREFPMNMDEQRVQNAIHHMSHAKVYAEQKWGHLEPTQERIDQLLAVVTENQNTYEHSDVYIRILEKWQKGDFSDSVSAHNSIWDIQNGNTGKATRLLTADEEKEYEEKYFK